MNSRPGSSARTRGRCRGIGGRCARHWGNRTVWGAVIRMVGGVVVLAGGSVGSEAEKLLLRERLDPVRRDSDWHLP